MPTDLGRSWRAWLFRIGDALAMLARLAIVILAIHHLIGAP